MFDPHLQNQFREFGFILDAVMAHSYLGIFILSIFVSYMLPLPEVVLLLLIGFIAKTTGINIWIAVFSSFTGTVIGDNALYRLSFLGNHYVQKFNRKMRSHKLIQYEHLVKDNFCFTIFFLRFITGIRFFGPVIAGTLGITWKKFFAYNFLATALHALFFILLGFYSHRKIYALIAEVEIFRTILLFSSVLIVGLLIKTFSTKKA